MRYYVAIFVGACLTVACGDDEPIVDPPPSGAGGGGGVVGCAAGERPLDDGSCQPAGVPPTACAQGFEPDDDRGCTPILPPAPCEEGTMALPGETTCREVAPCGDAPWGDIPVDGDTHYVDLSYTGMDSDGSPQKPWTSINAAIAAATPGAIIAIAEGRYVEDVLLFTKPMRLWGRCPALVEIEGTSAGLAGIDIRAAADGAEVHTLAVTGAQTGIGASGAEGVLFDRVWVHHNGRAAIALERTLGPGSVTIEGSLLEHARDFGIFDDSVDLDLSRSVIRDTQPSVGSGRGLNLQTTVHPEIATATITSSLFERNTEHAIFVFASELTIDGSVVQDTLPNTSNHGGRALDIEDDEETGERSNVLVRSCVFQRNMDIEVTCTGSDLVMEATTMRETEPQASDMLFGRGFSAKDDAGRANVTLRACTVVRVHDGAVVVDGSDVLLESVLIRDVGSQVADLRGGRGISIQFGLATPQRAALTARWSVVEGAREFGATSIGSDLTLEATLVRNVSGTEPDGSFGDGVSLLATDQPTNAWIHGSRIEASLRAGITSFGGSVEIGNTILECNPIPLNGETFNAKPATFTNAGGVVCGCAGVTEDCAVRSAMLTPPEPLEGQ